MALFVYTTERCEREAAESGWQEDLAKMRAKVEDAQDLRGFVHFPVPYRVKKKFPRYGARLIASMHKVGEHDVACFLTILTRADSDYDKFQSDPQAYGERHFANLIDEDTLDRFVTARAKQPSSPRKDPPSESEYQFLYPSAGAESAASENSLICESREWIEKVSQKPVSDRLTEFHALLSKLERGKDFEPIPHRPGWGILYYYHPELPIKVLLEAVSGESGAVVEDLRKKHAEILEANPSPSEEVILRHCRRAYPGYLDCGEDEWMEVQRDSVANIALSPEETRVLESGSTFPLFINGRAGSGKSTLLQYLFKNQLHLYLTMEKDAGFKPPLYLTLSADLLKQSRRVVESLLRCNAAVLAGSSGARQEQKHRQTLDAAFREFRQFLLSKISHQKHRDRFSPENRVDYARFRSMWRARFSTNTDLMKNAGPDVSWHAIRTYIKGMSHESDQDPEDFRQFDAKERQIPESTFDLIHEKIWEGWYKPLCENSDLWDDQDLARFLLDGDYIKAEHPAVFCDEAQDFTRLELEIILRLCLFSERDIRPHEIGRVPLAFAGDPFQTLNPTGFRWEATKAAFVEKFVLSLDPNRRSGISDLNYHELTFNYRSSPCIVRFSNLVQAMRSSLFGQRQISPQEPWSTDIHSLPVVWFDAEDASVWERLAKEPGTTLILPCLEGEELDYIKGNNVLSKHVRLGTDGMPFDFNVFSAGRAKGLEFERVAVFGFGGELPCKESIADLVRGGEHGSPHAGSMALKYFINRLYVAVSRPKRRLFILDTAASRDRLWGPATQPVLQDEIVAKTGRPNQWRPQTAGMIEGMLEHLDYESSVNFEEEARGLESEGLAQNDAYLLRTAARNYRLAGLAAKSSYCTASAILAERNYVQAGEMFTSNGYHKEAMECFWKAGRQGYGMLIQTASKRPELKETLEYSFAFFLTNASQWEQGLQALVRLADTLQHEREVAGNDSLGHWKDAASSAFETTYRLSETSTGAAWATFSKTLSRLEESGLKFPMSARAHIFYKTGDWANAASIWEELGETGAVEYREAKAWSTQYPDNLPFLSLLGRAEDVVRIYSENTKVPLDAQNAKTVGQAMVLMGQFDEALGLLSGYDCLPELGELAATALGAGKNELARTALHVLMLQAVRYSHWSAIKDYVNRGQIPLVASATSRILGSLRDEIRDSLDLALVKACARSPDLSDIESGEQRVISKFLRSFADSGKWTGNVSTLEMGSAIERAQRYTDAVDFYNSALSSEPSDQDRLALSARWFRSMQRLEDFYRRDKKLQKRADEIKGQLEEAKAKTALKPSDWSSEYPDLDSIDDLIAAELSAARGENLVNKAVPDTIVAQQPAASQRGDTKSDENSGSDIAPFSLDSLSLRFSKLRKRLNIENSKTLETATVRFSPFSIDSDDVEWQQKLGLMGECAEWNLLIDATEAETQGYVLVKSLASGLEVKLSLV